MPTIDDIDYSLLPFHMQEGMQAYLERGRPTGDFLFHILSNNFVGAAYHADDINQHRLYSYRSFLYSQCHPDAWGSEEKVFTWIKHHGFVGLKIEEGVEYAVGYSFDGKISGMVTDNFPAMKECFLYVPLSDIDNEDRIFCIFKHTKEGTEPIYHWIPKAQHWLPGRPMTKAEKELGHRQ